jgi:hypothetical protein
VLLELRVTGVVDVQRERVEARDSRSFSSQVKIPKIMRGL